jgi:hypothetical protein
MWRPASDGQRAERRGGCFRRCARVRSIHIAAVILLAGSLRTVQGQDAGGQVAASQPAPAPANASAGGPSLADREVRVQTRSLIGDGTINVTATRRRMLTGEMWTDLKITGDTLDLGQALRIEPIWTHPPKPGELPMFGTGPVLPMGFMRAITGEVEVTLDDLVIPPHHLLGFHAHAIAVGGLFEVTEATMTLDGGSISAVGGLDVTGEKPLWWYEATAHDIEPLGDLQPIMFYLMPMLRTRAKFDVTSSQSGEGFRYADLWRAQRGHIVIGLREGEIITDRPPSYIGKIVPALDTANYPFRKGRITCDLRGANVYVDIRLRTGDDSRPDTYSKGTVDLKGQTLQFEYGVDLASTVGVAPRPGNVDTGKTDLRVMRVEGPWASPKIVEWYELGMEEGLDAVRRLVWQDPIFLVDPTMSPAQKAEYIKRRINSVFGTAFRSFLFAQGSAKWLYEGATDNVKKVVQFLFGKENE